MKTWEPRIVLGDKRVPLASNLALFLCPLKFDFSNIF